MSTCEESSLFLSLRLALDESLQVYQPYSYPPCFPNETTGTMWHPIDLYLDWGYVSGLNPNVPRPMYACRWSAGNRIRRTGEFPARRAIPHLIRQVYMCVRLATPMHLGRAVTLWTRAPSERMTKLLVPVRLTRLCGSRDRLWGQLDMSFHPPDNITALLSFGASALVMSCCFHLRYSFGLGSYWRVPTCHGAGASLVR